MRFAALSRKPEYPQRDSNPCFSLERAATWTASRWGLMVDSGYRASLVRRAERNRAGAVATHRIHRRGTSSGRSPRYRESPDRGVQSQRESVPRTAGNTPPMRALAPIAVAVAGALAVGATAGAQQTGTLVVRLLTDPTPAGATWKYSGAGSAFGLGTAATARTVALQPGTYQLRETGGRAGQPRTLTALVCVDPSGDTTTSRATASASVVLGDGETVTCTFIDRAVGRIPSRVRQPALLMLAGQDRIVDNAKTAALARSPYRTSETSP